MKRIYFISILFMLGYVLNAQVLPEKIRLVGSWTEFKLVDQDDVELTPDQILYLGENGLDTEAYYSLSKRLRTATWICVSGAAVSLVAGTPFLVKGIKGDTDKRNVVGFFGCCGAALLFMMGDFAYTFASISSVRRSAHDAYMKIATTESGAGLTFCF